MLIKEVGSVEIPTMRSSVKNFSDVRLFANRVFFSCSVSCVGFAKYFISAGSKFGLNSAYRWCSREQTYENGKTERMKVMQKCNEIWNIYGTWDMRLREHVGLCGIIWDYLGLYGIIWDYVGLCGIMGDRAMRR